MRAVVTGGAGFIGSHVVDALLARGDEVTIVDNFSTGRRELVDPRATLLAHDIRERFSVPADVIFHLAAQADVGTSVEQPVFDAEVNVLGTVRVLEAAREANARVVFTSTGGALYGERLEPADESQPREPLSPYGTSKLAGEEYLFTWNRLHGTSHVVTRLANVYGPRQLVSLEGGVVAIFLNRMRAGEETRIYGDGEQSRDFVHVADVASALLAAAEGRGVYNVGTGERVTVNELHRLCAEAAGVPNEPRHVDPRAGDLRDSVLDASRARRELGWSPRPLADGLRETWDWVAAQ